MKQNFLRLIISGGYLTAQILTPQLAFAFNDHQIKKAQMQEVLNGLGYNTKKRNYTFGEIWQSNHVLFNEKEKQFMERWMLYFGDTQMPQIDVVETKNSLGELEYRWQVKSSEGSYTMSFLGGDDKFIKINNLTLSKKELFELIPAVEKINATRLGDISEKVINQKVKTTPPQLTYHDWTQMSANQRGEYLLNLRLALMDAEQVLEGNNKKQVSQILKKYEIWLKAALPEAEAAEIGQKCIVAGYVGEYQNGPHLGGVDGKVKKGIHCSVTHVEVLGEGNNDSKTQIENDKKSYSGNKKNEILAPSRKLFGKYNSQCSGTGPMVSCNPYVFGMNANGSPICISMSKSSFSTATAQCELAAPLNQQNLEADSKKLIQSLLKAKNEIKEVNKKTVEDFLNCQKDCKITRDAFEDLKAQIVDPFNLYVGAALQKCNEEEKKHADKNQDSACLVMENRRLALNKFIELIQVVNPTAPPQTAPSVGTTAPAQPTQPQKPPVANAPVSPAQPAQPAVEVVAVSSQAGARPSSTVANGDKKGFCSEYRMVCMAPIFAIPMLAYYQSMKAQTKITTTAYVPAAVTLCPSSWIQTGSTAADCRPPNWTGSTTTTPVAPPVPIITSPTGSSSSGGTR